MKKNKNQRQLKNILASTSLTKESSKVFILSLLYAIWIRSTIRTKTMLDAGKKKKKRLTNQ